MKLYSARGRCVPAKKKRNVDRVDLRVKCPGWGQVMWHRLLGFYFQNKEFLSKAEFQKRDAYEVHHRGRDPKIVYYRRLRSIEPQGGL